MKHLLEYSPVEGFLPLAQHHAAAHQQRLREFVADDPFVTGGVVASWRIRPWREVLAP